MSAALELLPTAAPMRPHGRARRMRPPGRKGTPKYVHLPRAAVEDGHVYLDGPFGVCLRCHVTVTAHPAEALR